MSFLTSYKSIFNFLGTRMLIILSNIYRNYNLTGEPPAKRREAFNGVIKYKF